MTYPMRPFELHRPADVAEAVALAGEYPGAKYLAGGTDLVVNLRRRIAEPDHVIALGAIDGLGEVTREGDALAIGARVTMAELAAHPEVMPRLPMLAEAAGIVAGPTIRGMATLGGNLVLDTRCRYYNQSFFWRQANDFCLKKDGSVCPVAPRGSFCWAAFSADTPPVLLALDAVLELTGPEGGRKVPLRNFYGNDGRWSIGEADGGLLPGELILRVRIPLPQGPWRGVYEKVRVRGSIDYPLAGLAMMVRWKDETAREIADLRMALTALNPQPMMVPGTEAFSGRKLNPDAVAELTRLAGRTGKPMRTTVSDPAYRRAMIATMVEKAAARLAPGLGPALLQQARWA